MPQIESSRNSMLFTTSWRSEIIHQQNPQVPQQIIIFFIINNLNPHTERNTQQRIGKQWTIKRKLTYP